jgi:hypothetical protein
MIVMIMVMMAVVHTEGNSAGFEAPPLPRLAKKLWMLLPAYITIIITI